MIKKCYIYKVADFYTFDGLVDYMNDREICPDKIISVFRDLDHIRLIYFVKEFRDYRKDGSYEKIC